ncbi:MAG: MBL fold metallo-hydrolase [Candidatus Kerfeldbacteria bacterium]|nr:MBL fold metallo-hydrolase [Candidatus Kerfeldbacteria bacterium]
MNQKKIKQIIVSGSFLIVLIAFLFVTQLQQRPAGVRVTFFDIGQGDSALIQTSAGSTILIDGGPDRTILEKLGAALPFYEHSIDLMILTHPHADHLNGLLAVLERYEVKNILYTDVAYDAPQYDEWLQRLESVSSKKLIAHAGQTFTFDEVQLEVLYPLSDMSGQSIDDINESSIVARLSYQNNSILFTGDAGVPTEQVLLNAGVELESDILKVGHHGSDTSSSIVFINAVSPAIAVISLGNNTFGHPKASVLKRLEYVGAAVKRTDQLSDIVIELPLDKK